MLMKKLFTLFVSLWMAIASLFAANISANTVIYFDASAYTNIQTSIASGKTLQMLLGHSTWSQGYKMTAVDGYDNIYSVKMPKWDGCTQLAFCTVDSEWGGEGSSVTSRLNWTYEKTAVHSISSNMSGNVGFAGNPLTRTNNYTLPVKAPKITVAAAPEFATTTVGETSNATLKYTLENATEATATIEGEGFSISAQEVGSVTIVFAPEAEGDYTGTLTITSGEVKETVEISATGLAKDVVKEPEVLNLTAPEFAEIIEGNTTTAVATYELLNAEEADAKVEGEGFEITEQEVGKVTIEFAPTKAGEYTGTLIILVAGEALKEVAFTATAKPSPYYAIRGSMTDWSDKNDIKLIANEDKSEYSIKEFEIASGDEFKVVYVNEENVTTWYGVSSVEKNPEIGNNIGSDNIVLPAGKYDIYYKVKEGKIWIQKYVAPEEPKPSLTVSTEEVVFEEVELGEEPVVITETITYTVENSEEAVVLALESDVFTAEDAEGTITITFAPVAEGEYTAELTLTLGDIVKTVAISGAAKAAEIVDPEEPKINIIVADFERNTAEVGDETDAAVVYSLENIESAEVEIEGEYVTFAQEEVEEGFMIAVFFRPEEVGEFPGKLTITAGEISEEIEFTFIATEPQPEIISIKVAAPENWESCYLWAWEIGGKDLFDVFPGVSMPKGEDGFYVMNLEISGPIGFMVSNGSGIQTEAYNDVDENTCFNVVSVEGNLILEVNEDCQYVAPEIPKVTFTVRVPSGTEVCYIAGTPLWSPIEMEKVEGEENMFTITTDLLNGQAWKYCAGPNFDYVELTADGGAVMDRTDYGDPDVVERWKKIYDPDFEPIEPYYAIRGLNGDASWTGSGDIKLEESADGSEWSASGFTVAEGESFKVIYIDENDDVSGYYAGLEEGCEVGQTYDDNGNLVLPAGTYDLYFKSVSKLMWIAKKDTPTDVEDAVAELIYAIDGTIYAPAPFAIIDLSGKDVTNVNGALEGAYIVKTQNSVTKVLVK